jgi:ribonucleoside-diphosphate reductase beta chain
MLRTNTIDQAHIIPEVKNESKKTLSNSPLFTPNPVYKPFSYPWAFEAWLTQQRIHWMPEEVPMFDDIRDWKCNLTKDEIYLLTSIFRFFTQSDIEVNDCYMGYYQNLFEPTEIKMMIAAFSNMETMHTHAYSYVIDTLDMDESEYGAFLKFPEMGKKWEYMQRYGDHSLHGLAMTLARFGAFTEGLQLFAAFAILMNFPRFNKMKGMGQIISWSIRDETLHVQSLIRLFHTILNEHPHIKTEAFMQELVMECEIVVKQEDAFIDLAFNNKYIEGISAEESKLYIRYIADRRLEQLGAMPIYKVQNPYPWMESLQNEYVNFFENKASEYSKSATEGNWSDAFADYEKFKTTKQEPVVLPLSC